MAEEKETVTLQANSGRVTFDGEGNFSFQVHNRLLQREGVTAFRVEAFNTLAEKLAAATVLLRVWDDGGRAGVSFALSAITDYLVSRGIPFASLEPMTALRAAFVDADAGTAPKLFEVRRNAGGQRRGTEQEVFEGMVAVIVDCCVAHFRNAGQRPYSEIAARHAAKLVNLSSVDGRAFSFREVQEIREKVRSSRQGFSRQVFDELTSSALVKADPLKWAELLAESPQFAWPPISG